MIQSLPFWAVIAGSVPVYWLLPQRIRAGFLALVSTGYLAYLAPRSTAALLGWVLAFYSLVPLLGKDRPYRLRILTGLILLVVGFLAYYKYIPPLLAALAGRDTALKLVIPLGISYYTFKLIHYAVESGRGNIPSRSFWQFLCYMTLYPIFTAGPIERFDRFLANQAPRWQAQFAAQGLTRIAHGLVKKLLLAECLLAHYTGTLTNENLIGFLPTMTTPRLWLYVWVLFLRMYLDFSAYSDLAVGISRLYGLQIMENFNFPFLATSLGDFWRRWHRSLSQWCQTYVYMPLLGLYRNPYLSVYASLIVFGLWHSGTLTRLCWALYHATGVAVFTLWSRARRRRSRTRPHRWLWTPLGWVLTQGYIAGSMAFIVAEHRYSFYEALRVLGKLVFVDLPA